MKRVIITFFLLATALVSFWSCASCSNTKKAAGTQKPTAAKTDTAAVIKELIRQREEGDFSCVIYNDGEYTTYTQSGVKDLYDLVKNHPDVLKGAIMVDKVVGKGAASLMIIGGIVKMHTHIIAAPAVTLLEDAGVKVTYDEAVDHIINRDKTDWCPLEKRVRDCATAQEALPVIEGFIDDLTHGRPLYK